MLRRGSKIILYLFAYLLLFIVLILNNVNDTRIGIMITSAIVIVVFVSVILLLETIRSVAPSKEKVTIHHNKNVEYLGFLVTYLIPFMVELDSATKIASFILLFSVVTFLYLDTSLFCMNPLLKIFFRYNIYEISLDGNKYYLLSKKRHMEGIKHLNLKNLDDEILMEEDAYAA